MYQVKRTSAGLGLFAARDFKRGDRIIEYKGPKVSYAAVKGDAKYLMTLDGDIVIDGKGRENTARYINHSCKPNAQALVSRKVFIYARKRIKAGEEITMDYGRDYWEALIKPKGCKCAACAVPVGRRKTAESRAQAR